MRLALLLFFALSVFATLFCRERRRIAMRVKDER